MIRMDSSGWEVWSHAAEILYGVDEDATLWDLAKGMYRYYNNKEVPIAEPNDYELVTRHLDGLTPVDIADPLEELSDEAIRDYLVSMGFEPWKYTINCNCYALFADYNIGYTVIELCGMYEVSRYITEKIIKEFQHARFTGF